MGQITRIKAAFVIGFENDDHCIWPQGELVHEDEKIIFVGRGYEGRVDREIDAGHAVVSPGFVDTNALADIDHALFDSWPKGDRRLGLMWSEEYLHNHGPVFTREEMLFRRQFAISQLVRNGITTIMPIAAETYFPWCEDYQDMALLAGAVKDLGIRGYLGPSYRALVPYTDGTAVKLYEDEAKGIDGLQQALRFAEDYDGSADGRIRAALLPARIETQTERTLKLTRSAADELDLPVRLHAAQGLSEMEMIFARTGKRSIPYLHEIGFLKEKTFIPHVWTVPGNRHMPEKYGQGDDVKLLGENGTSVIYCPIPTAHYGGGIDNFDDYLAKGTRVVMGTDSAPPNMIRGLDLAMAMTKTLTAERSTALAEDLFRAATVEPARALGRDDIGRLSVGAQADYFVLDLASTHIGPHVDPIRTLIMNGDGRDINRVVVGGKTIVEDRQIVTVDTSSYVQKAQNFMDKYVASFSASDFKKRDTAQLFPSTYPVR